MGKNPEIQELCQRGEGQPSGIVLAIRGAREAAGLTQKELANMIGTTQSAISRLEDSDYEGYILKMLEKIAEVIILPKNWTEG